jgi:hypothetical protein
MRLDQSILREACECVLFRTLQVELRFSISAKLAPCEPRGPGNPDVAGGSCGNSQDCRTVIRVDRCWKRGLGCSCQSRITSRSPVIQEGLLEPRFAHGTFPARLWLPVELDEEVDYGGLERDALV